MGKAFITTIFLVILLSSCLKHDVQVIFKSDKYTVYTDSVVQYPYKANVLSATEIVSDYKSPEDEKINSRGDV